MRRPKPKYRIELATAETKLCIKRVRILECGDHVRPSVLGNQLHLKAYQVQHWLAAVTSASSQEHQAGQNHHTLRRIPSIPIQHNLSPFLFRFST
jgi:hypothetical protein